MIFYQFIDKKSYICVATIQKKIEKKHLKQLYFIYK